MKIQYVKIDNYRNLDGCEVFFHKKNNYVIGENNIGKSNLLTLLETVFSGKAFAETDFEDVSCPIEITVQLVLSEHEQGFFGDLFSPKDSRIINILFKQDVSEAYPSIINIDSGESICQRQIKRVHFLKYNSTAVPEKELKLDSKRGIGTVVNHIIEKYTNENDSSTLINNDYMSGVEEYLNERLSKIRSFNDYKIQATHTDTDNNILSKLLYLSDGERALENTGSGIQYVTMATINLLTQIMSIYNGKAIPFEEQLYTNENGEKILPIVLAIDEPEVHLHPFLQRSLINYYKKILNNKDNDFLDLIKQCFDIDGLSGQLIVVTHSTDALVDDYRNLIRFYKDEQKTTVVCGNKLRLQSNDEKHLLLHFPEIKEAFYSKCAILVEGVTEYGCISSFAGSLGIALDDYGISVISANGEGSIEPLRKLFAEFGINSVLIYDRDVKQGQTPKDYEFFTSELCFEIEIVKNLYRLGKSDLVSTIVDEFDQNARNDIIQSGYLDKPLRNFGYDITKGVPRKLAEVDPTNEQGFCCVYAAWLYKNKGIILGRLIGQLLTNDLIPSCYVDAIKKAAEVASNV